MNKQELIKHFEEMEYVSVSQMGKKAFIDLIEQLNEPQKPVVPQFVADWYEKNKDSFDYNLWEYLTEWERQEPMRMKGLDLRTKYLYYGMGSKTWLFKPELIDGLFRKTHTRKELENAGFVEVFNSPLFEVEEVTE